MLTVFVLSLVYLIITILSSKNITPDMLKLPKKNADYKKMDFESQTFNVLKNMASQKQWVVSLARNSEDKFWTDFMVPFAAARSPHGKKNIVPFYYFEKKSGINKCPFTGKPLPQPEGEKEPPEEKDRDADGIPNDVEKELGLNPDDPDDALGDMDNDGFSNIDELKQDKLWVNDAKLHPPLAKRLCVVNIIKSKIPIKLKRVRAVGSNKKDWEIHAEVFEKGRWRSKFPKLNEVLNIGGRNYTITDVVDKKDKVFVKSLNSWTEKDSSIVVLQDNDSKDIIKAEVGESVFAPRMRALLQDVLTEKKYTLSVGDEFTIGSEEQGFENYKIVNADPKTEEVTVVALPGNTTFSITREKMNLPPVSSIKKKHEIIDEDPMRMPPAAPGINPRGRKLR